MKSVIFFVLFISVSWAALYNLGWAREWLFYPLFLLTVGLTYLLHKSRQLPKRS